MKSGLSTFAFFVLTVVVALRPLVVETYDPAGSAMIDALGADGNPTPLRTLCFDGVILIAAAITFATRALDPRRTSARTGLRFGFMVIVFASALSCAFAGNKRLAINGTIDWLCGPIAAIALAELLRHGWRRQVLLAAILGSAVVQAAACYEQSWIGFSETWEHYQKAKDEFWANQGVASDDPEVELFEARMNAREASGTFAHSNVAGSYLVLCGLTVLGVAQASGWRRMLGRNLPAGLAAAAILAATFLTGSKGAMVALALAAIAWAVLTRWCHIMAPRRRRVFAGAWIAVALAGAAVIGHGVYRGGLPGASLNFRWQYWTASAGMIADHPWTGVGRENFGRHYLRYKSIQSPEEVSNPHNLIVQAAADWGVLGAVGLLAMLIGGSWTLVRENRGADAADANRSCPPEYMAGDGERRPRWAWLAAAGLAVVVGRLLSLGTTDGHYLYYTGMTTALFWFAGATAVWVAFAADAAGVDSSRGALGAVLGLFAFALHETINFSLFVPATSTTAFAIFALCVAQRETGSVEPAPVGTGAAASLRRWLPPGLCCFAVLLLLVFGVIPVARAAAARDSARARSRRLDPSRAEASIAQTAALYLQAADADPLDPTAPAELANLDRWLANERGSASKTEASASAVPGPTATGRYRLLTDAERALAHAIDRDPDSIALRRARRSLLLDLAAVAGDPRDTAVEASGPRSADAYERCIKAAHEVLDRYPQSPPDWVSLGDIYVAAAADADAATDALAAADADAATDALATADADATLSDRGRQLRDSALRAYRHALALDDSRPAWEKYRRLRPAVREAVQSAIVRIESDQRP